MITRREALSALSALAWKPGYNPRLAAQCYVWTQQFSAEKKSLADGMEEMFAATRRAGYTRMELIAAFLAPEVRARTSGLVKKHHLEIPIVYAGGPMHELALAEKTVADALETAEAARGLGTAIINTNPNPKPKRERKTDEELAVQARYVNRLAAELRKRQMRLILHHHNPEMAEDAREWRHLLKNTEAGICMDVDWVIRGGQDPLKLLHEARPRVASLHLRNARKGVWTQSLGEGDYDYTAVARVLREIDFDGHLVVELAHEKGIEITRGLEENLRLSREFAEHVFGVRG